MSHSATCSHCNTEFTSRKPKKFCSQECYFASMKRDVEIDCAFCGKRFTKPYRFRDAKTCSRECFSGLMSRIVDTSVTKKCLACGVEFRVKQGDAHRAKYHSYECFLSTRKTRQQPVVVKCETCGKDFTVAFNRSTGRRFCGKSCANVGENNAMFGKPGTMTGKVPWLKGLTKQTDTRVRAMGEKMSTIIADKIINGEWTHSTGFKGEHYVGKKNGGEETYLRSSYESMYARMLDSDEAVESWRHEPFRIPYFFEGSMHNYVPDFSVRMTDGTNALVEVKPLMLTESKANAAKKNAAEQWCSLNNFLLLTITEKDLDGPPSDQRV